MKRITIKTIIPIALFAAFMFDGIVNGNDVVRFDRIPIQASIQHFVTDITQDEMGFMWFATRSGLYRFDGYAAVEFKHDPRDPTSISGNNIILLNKGQGSILWLATESGAINQLNTDTGTATHYRFEPSTRTISANVQIHDLTVDSQGTVWTATSLGGLHKYDRRSDSFETFLLPVSSDIDFNKMLIRQIIAEEPGTLLLSVERVGPVILNTSAISARLLGDGKYDVSQWGEARIFKDGDDNFWIGTWGNGLMSYNPATGLFSNVQGLTTERFGNGIKFIKSIATDTRGNLWIVPLDEGVIRFDPKNGAIEQFRHIANDLQSINSDRVEVVFGSRKGIIWIGSASGINNYSEYRYKFDNQKIDAFIDGGDRNHVLSLYLDSAGDLWVGTLEGLYRRGKLAGAHENFRLNQVEEVSEVTAIIEDSSNSFYVGTGTAGLLRVDRNSGTAVSLTEPQQISSMIEDSDGTLWIGTYVNGVGSYNPVTESFDYWSPDPDDSENRAPFDVTCIYEDSNKFLWIGSNGRGLVRYNKERQSYIHFRYEEGNSLSLSDSRVLSICEDQRGNIWIGTQNGLNRLNPETNGIDRFYEGDILPDNTVCSILEDDEGNLWFSTLGGITRFDPGTNNFFHYSAADGLQGNWFNPGAAIKSPTGQLFWGGVSGYTSYLPDTVPENPHKPIVAITAFRVLDAMMPLNPGRNGMKIVELQYDQNFFSFEFSALDYVNPDKNNYSYILENLENEWVMSANRRFARYTKVPPGDYTFRVRGSNNDGLWNEEGTSVRVIIHPPFWMTWQFRGFLILVGVLLIFGMLKLRLRIIQRQKDLLELEVAERSLAQAKLERNQNHLRALAARLTFAEELERKRISRALHDDVGHALLTSKVKIIAHMDDEEKSNSGKALQEVIDSLNDTIKIVRSLTVEISPPALHKFGLESAAERLVEKFGEENNILTRFSKGPPCSLDDRLSILLYQSLRELLVNILKHAEAETVRLSFNNDGERIYVRLQDDGKGFDVERAMESEEELKGFGLFSIKERLESIGGELKIESVQGQGTTIIMIGPLSENSGQAEK